MTTTWVVALCYLSISIGNHLVLGTDSRFVTKWLTADCTKMVGFCQFSLWTVGKFESCNLWLKWLGIIMLIAVCRMFKKFHEIDGLIGWIN